MNGNMIEYSVDTYLKLAEEYKVINSEESFSKKTSDEFIIANKYNFFKLDKVVKNKFSISEGISPFSIFPIQNIIVRWLRYVEGVNSKLKKFNKKISLKNTELANLLLRLSKIKAESQTRRKDLLRALGAICGDVFIGPYSIVVDLFHSCNTNCIHCWIHYPNRKGVGYLSDFKKKMDVEMFRNIAEKAREIGTEKICLLANGEPLMHPQITEIINICYENKLEFETVTNGVFMTESLSRLMVDSGVTIITVSLPATTAQSYKQICPKSPLGDFGKVKKNIKDLISYRNNIGKNVEVHITHVIHNLTCYDLLKFVEMDIELGVDTVLFKIILLDDRNYFLKLDEGQINYLKNHMPEAITRLKANGIRTDELANTYLDFYENAQGLRTKDFFAEKGCLVGWSFCNIQVDGEVLFCCGNKMVDSLQGDCFDKIWFSEKYNFYRIAAKHTKNNRHVEFARGEKLFDDKCNSCENVNEHSHILNTVREHSLENFL